MNSTGRFGTWAAAFALAALGAAASFAPSAQAQNSSQFTLLGSPSAQGAAIPPEQQFVHPITDPYFHEDSFITTDARAWFVYHKFPEGGAINGGDAKVYAVQFRLAITDRLQLVAYKDGYTDFSSGLLDASGWNDVGAGLKYALIQDWVNQFHISIGMGYEFAIGDQKVLQNNSEIRAWASVNKGFGPLHLGATLNVFYATSTDEPLGYSDYFSYHLHADYYVCKWFSPVVELNGYHAYNKHGDVSPFSGIDVTNLGGGDDVATVGIGGEFRVCKGFSLRAAYELPITSGDDLYGYRITASAVINF